LTTVEEDFIISYVQSRAAVLRLY